MSDTTASAPTPAYVHDPAAGLDALPRDARLAGRTALVTGSSSGIGEAIARVLAASGARVAVSGRDTARLERVVDAITAAGGEAVAVEADLTAEPAELRAAAARAEAALGGRVDILVNNAGVYPGGPTPDLADDALAALLNTNIRAPHALVAALAPGMVERGHGVIVNTGSWMARVGVPYKAIYPATEAAIEQLTRAWAAEFGPRGIRVNGVAPGATATPGNASSAAIMPEMTKGTVLGRAVQPIEIAYAVRWLASDEAAAVHGISLDVDGGIAATRLG
ncbi:SDR family oxidoreductase [Schumannella luteola]|uniref:NAD(P)-dependent dehydrogenase (Short-subunit alcohol dehydrogenase family) n=1 Tax=Schumannella luteola TaxID=472059 RepID=A0A852YTS2_9MICO|nr:SDR family oxidoreductase [Schumannella luteola]NYH00716.1 NAD(P)-dependent dehydrogenase (short-subunit alcohol dehydrogenase family) [Schumannella luteola]TPX03932.1 SDR family oxidoreductase [Schumannella luteola]